MVQQLLVVAGSQVIDVLHPGRANVPKVRNNATALVVQRLHQDKHILRSSLF